MIAPCKDCTDRFVTETSRCHDTCTKYKEFLEYTNAIKMERQRINNTSTISSAKQWTHNALSVHVRKER